MNREDSRPLLQLSQREQQLITLASQGLTDTAIAHRLEISEATVGTYWGRIRIKIGPYSRTELVSRILKSELQEEMNALRAQNQGLVEELQSAARESTGGELFYQALIENAPDAMLLVTESGIVSSANAAAHELFAYEPGTMGGIPIIDLVPERFREIHRSHREGYMADPKRRQMGEHLATPAVQRDGFEFMVRASLSTIETPTGLIVMCAIRPLA